MSKSVGIVAEYNPFHTGHGYQTAFLAEKGYKNIAVCMSGSCVQRGEFAFMSKFARAKMALENGVSLVAEMPYPFSRRSAEGFAMRGMETLKALGVDAVSFGSECRNAELLQEIADYLLSREYEKILKENLSQNLPFAKARERAIFSKFDISRQIVSARNDILAIEYLKACKKLNWHPEIVVVKRQGAGYNDSAPKSGFASAGGIREMAASGRLDSLVQYIPPKSLKTFESNFYKGQYFLPDDAAFEKAMLFVLRGKNYEDFLPLPDCNTELAHALERAVSGADSLRRILDSLPTKQYTRARLNRIMLAAFLNLKIRPKNIEYIRVLGIRADREEYFGAVCKKCPLPISHSSKILSGVNASCRQIAAAEAAARDAQSAFFKISGEAREDFRAKFIKL